MININCYLRRTDGNYEYNRLIHSPNTDTCILKTTFEAVAVSTVLAKTITVVLAFSVTAPGRRMRQLLVSGAQNSIVSICSLIQPTLCGIWTGTNPPYIDTDTQSEHGHIIILCNKGSLTAFCYLNGQPSECVSATLTPGVICHISHTEIQGVIILGCLDQVNDKVSKDGDVMISAFFPLLTNEFHLDGRYGPSIETELHANNYQYVLALVFAIEEVNSNAHLLPNTSLGFDLYNLFNDFISLETFLTWLSGFDAKIPNYTCRGESKSAVVLTETPSAVSSLICTLLELYKFPQLSFGVFDPVLSDNGQFSSLYQMSPKDTSLTIAMASLMLYFNWDWIGIVISKDEKGVQFLSALREEMERNKICVAFVHIIPTHINVYMNGYYRYNKQIVTSSANVVIIFGGFQNSVLAIFRRWEYFNNRIVWVTTSQWDASTSKRHFLFNPFQGTLIFSQHHDEVSGFKNFIQTVNPSKYPEDIFLARLWWLHFNCSVSESTCQSLENCSSYGSLEWLPWYKFDMAMSEGSYNIYNAVHTVAYALHEMLLQVDIELKNIGKRLGFSPWQLHFTLKNLQFKNFIGDTVDMNQKRKLSAEYDILNLWDFPKGLGHKVKVGTFSPYLPRGQQLSLSEEMIEWATDHRKPPNSVCSSSCSPGFRKSHRERKVVCCFDCIPCPENEISNETNMDRCLKCADHQYPSSKQNLCLQRAVTFVAFEEPLGMSLATMALCFSLITVVILGLFVKHRDTPIVKANNKALSYTLLISLTFCFLCSLLFIGRPNTASCILQQITFGITFTVAISSVLAKTTTVILAFNISASSSRMRWLLVSHTPNFIIPICTLIQIILCGVWIGTNPPYLDTDPHSEHGQIIIVCNKGSLTAFYCVLGYLGSLALVSFTVAFLARNLPDTFNEAKFLTFSMLMFCSVWVTFLPVYYSTKGKVIMLMEAFTIQASSAGLLGCIFFPKCYFILLRPEMNSLHQFRATVHSKGKNSY
ncbi:vomeronasal type-2 receptor 116-like [Octodon degus]|uniref:Vomeronasal type-2 receptor 116-like n=1 Tax=Octodon degus TaxID=10160 RepID=A0A6P3FE80_OCTDE|nr:vomeronasal type-2 receptor 116-like [Octodon degus]